MIKICTGYKIDGKITDQMPYDVNMPIEPIYKDFKGWKKDITAATTMAELPQELIDYIKFIENEVKVPFSIISVGPDRKQTIIKG